MILVGISGGIGHGKTTFANYLAACSERHRHWESSDLIIDVANALRARGGEAPNPDNLEAINHWLAPLPDILAREVRGQTSLEAIAITADRLAATPENYGKLFEYLRLLGAQPRLRTVRISPRNKRAFRPLLQWLGGYLVNVIGGDIWFAEIVRRIQADDTLELATVGGLRYPADARQIRQAGGYIVNITRPGRRQLDHKDLTERQRELIAADATILNNGSLDQLRLSAEQFWSDLQHHSLAVSYDAAEFSM